jgi:hypothetical protein
MRNMVFAAFLILSAYTASAADSFINGMEDIPLPAQAVQIRAEDLSFGNEETRLIEAYLQVKPSQIAKVKDFYLETLPQLGWTFEGLENKELHFVRGQEELLLAESKRHKARLRLTLTGRP